MTDVPVIRDQDDLERWVAELPADQVARNLARVMDLQDDLRGMRRMLESRLIADGAQPGEVYEIDGEAYLWAGDRHRECSDPAALREALRDLRLGVLAQHALKEAFVDQPPKMYLTHLDRIAQLSTEAAEVIRDWLRWKEGPPRLRPLDK